MAGGGSFPETAARISAADTTNISLIYALPAR